MAELISCHTGHLFQNVEKNKYKIWKDERGLFVEMFTNRGSFYFDNDDFELVTNDDGKKITWCMKIETKLKYRIGYYVYGKINKKRISLHQLVMGHWGNGNAGLTVDHIDRNPLNNRRYNLRLATKSEQSSNITKRERGCHAVPLPDEINSSELPKYVSYTRYNRNTPLGYYDFFIIQCHPCQKKGEKWTTQMSMSITIKDKLKQAIEKIKEYDAMKTCDVDTDKTEKCIGINISGTQCNNNAEKGQKFCKIHNPITKLLSVETCSANNKHGNRCKKEPLSGTLMCRYHAQTK